MTSHRPRPLPHYWRTLPFYHRPALIELAKVRHCLDSGAGVARMAPKWLRCFAVGCDNEHSSHHLLPTSENAVDYFCFWRQLGLSTSARQNKRHPFTTPTPSKKNKNTMDTNNQWGTHSSRINHEKTCSSMLTCNRTHTYCYFKFDYLLFIFW